MSAQRFGVYGGFSGVYTLLEEITRGSDTTDQDFSTTLSGNTDKGYLVEVMLINNSGATASYSLRMNGSGITSTQQYSFAYGGSLYAASESSSRFMALGTSGIAQIGVARIDFPFMDTGHERFYRWESSHAGSSATVDWWAAFGNFSSPSTATNITSLGIGCNQTNGIGTGSVLRLYKLKGV